MEKPNGSDSYLVRTKWGGIYLISRPCTKKGINYYDSIYYDCCSLKDEDIEEWHPADGESLDKALAWKPMPKEEKGNEDQDRE